MLGWGGSPAGALLAGFAADRVPIRWVPAIAVAALLAGVVLAVRARSRLADLDPAPAGQRPAARHRAADAGPPRFAVPASPGRHHRGGPRATAGPGGSPGSPWAR
jgi:hypothetical protein